MDFLSKKIISNLLLPLPISLFFFILGLIFLWFIHKKKYGISFLFSGIVILWVFSTAFIPNHLLNALESQYQPLQKAPSNIHNIVVLGGGVRISNHFPPNTQLNSASLSRLVEGIRLYQQLQKKGVSVKLILSGGRVFNAPSEAGKMHNTASALGVSSNDLVIEDGSTDTHQEAVFLQSIIGDHPFILVTSATHMPRAMAIFNHLGMKPIPAPTQFLSKTPSLRFMYFIPSAINLIHADIALHEYLGFIWGKMQNYL